MPQNFIFVKFKIFVPIFIPNTILYEGQICIKHSCSFKYMYLQFTYEEIMEIGSHPPFLKYRLEFMKYSS